MPFGEQPDYYFPLASTAAFVGPNLTAVAGVTFTTVGELVGDGCAVVDGVVGSYLTTPAVSPALWTGDISHGGYLWVNYDVLADAELVVFRNDAGNAVWEVWLVNTKAGGRKFNFAPNNLGGGDSVTTTVNLTGTEGTWLFVGWSYNATTDVMTLVVGKAGVLTTDTGSLAGGTTLQPGGTIRLGGYTTGSTDGKLGPIAMWSGYAPTAADFTYAFNGGIGIALTETPGTRGWLAQPGSQGWLAGGM